MYNLAPKHTPMSHKHKGRGKGEAERVLKVELCQATQRTQATQCQCNSEKPF